jgi:hypothetical protein
VDDFWLPRKAWTLEGMHAIIGLVWLFRVKPQLHKLPMEIGVRLRKRKIHPEIRPTAPLPPNRAGSLPTLQMWVSVLSAVGSGQFPARL